MTSRGPAHSEEQSVLVVAATGGVGKALCEQLKSDGYHVTGSCRTKHQQKKLMDDGLCDQALVMNLGSSRSIGKAFDVLLEQGIDSLYASINCAAITQAAVLETMSEKYFRDIMQINVIGTLQVAQRSIPLLRQQQAKAGRSGRLIFIGSSGGDIALPALGGYSASKFALEALADTFRRELAPWQIPVSLVKPGAIRTQMTLDHLDKIDAITNDSSSGLAEEYRQQYKAHRKSMAMGYRNGVEPGRVAETVIKALKDKQPAPRYLVGAQPALLNYGRRILPDRAQDRLLARLLKTD